MLAAAPAWAQVQITSSPNPVGSGARALGMGAAFIAVADDATAASWNPGGLTQLERPEFSLVYSNKFFSEDFGSSDYPELDTSDSVSISEINYISAVYPIKHTFAGRNMVLSLNYQKKYDFDRDISGARVNQTLATSTGDFQSFSANIDYKQRGQLSALSPAFAIELTDKLSVGATVNIWNSSLLSNNKWSSTNDQLLITRFNGKVFPFSFFNYREKLEYDNFDGLNFTLGALYKPNPRWGIGVVYNSKFTADVQETRTTNGGLAGISYGYRRRTTDLEYVFPSSIGLGVSYRFPNDKLTLSFDVTRTEWNQFIIHDPNNRSISRQRRSGVTGQSLTTAPEIDPTYTVRVGMEYVFVNPKKPRQDYLPSLRAGLFYDPEPSGGRESTFWGLSEGDGSPDPFYGFTLGTGVLIKNRVNIDAAYTYRTGDGARSDTFGLSGTDADVDQHLFYLSTVIYF